MRNQQQYYYSIKDIFPGWCRGQQVSTTYCILISVTSLPLMSIFHICWDMCNSPELVVSRKAASAIGSSGGKISAVGKRKSTANTSSFHFDLLHIVITISKGSDVQIFKYKLIYFLAIVKLVIPSCNLLTIEWVCSIPEWMHENISLCKKCPHLGNECWRLHGGRALKKKKL